MPPRKAKPPAHDQPMKAMLLHLGHNMWCDWQDSGRPGGYIVASPRLRFDLSLWRDLARRMADGGLNALVIDLGEGIKYESHPELAVRGSWSPARLKRELDRLRKLGIEPIPKLNFSACHDIWLGPYSRMVSTDIYYGVCKDLIAEVIDLFDRPRFFHLGMDEETAANQKEFQYVVVRQFDLWWNDFYFLVDCVQRGGSRAWIWSDYAWHNPKSFYAKMPREVLQSNWFYGDVFSLKNIAVKTYIDLEKHRYDQVPTGSNHNESPPRHVNFQRTVRYCTRHIAPKRLLGFLHAPWRPTVEVYRRRITTAVEQASAALARWNGKRP